MKNWGHCRPIPKSLHLDRSDCENDRQTTDMCGELHDELAEQSYRRGYYQGYHAALHDIDSKSRKQILDFILKHLVPWRYKKTLLKTIFPPDLARGQK